MVSKSGKVKSKSGGGGGQKLALLEDKLVQMIAAGPASFYPDADASGEGDGGIQFEEDHGDMSLSWLRGVEYPISGSAKRQKWSRRAIPSRARGGGGGVAGAPRERVASESESNFKSNSSCAYIIPKPKTNRYIQNPKFDLRPSDRAKLTTPPC